jgi:lysophospholipase L1-like esterase
VDELNQFLVAYCAQQKVPIIDMSPLFNENGCLRKNITHDGVHLSAEGYRLWAAEVKKVLGQLGY